MERVCKLGEFLAKCSSLEVSGSATPGRVVPPLSPQPPEPRGRGLLPPRPPLQPPPRLPQPFGRYLKISQRTDLILTCLQLVTEGVCDEDQHWVSFLLDATTRDPISWLADVRAPPP